MLQATTEELPGLSFWIAGAFEFPPMEKSISTPLRPVPAELSSIKAGKPMLSATVTLLNVTLVTAGIATEPGCPVLFVM